MLDVGAGERGADRVRRGDLAAVVVHERHGVDLEAEAGACFVQHAHVAAAAVTEVEVLAFDRDARVPRADDDLVDERLGRFE